MIDWIKRQWWYWAKPENRKHIWEHLIIGTIGSVVLALLSIWIFGNSITLWWIPIALEMSFIGVTIGWEICQFWGRWDRLFYDALFDSFMDVFTANFVAILIIINYIWRIV